MVVPFGIGGVISARPGGQSGEVLEPVRPFISGVQPSFTGRAGRTPLAGRTIYPQIGPSLTPGQAVTEATGIPVAEGTALFGLPLAALLAKFGPALLAGLGGAALGGILGGGNGGGGDEEGEVGMPVGGPTGVQFPWETPAGEGFIAPWTQQVGLPSGLTGQVGAAYPGAFGGIGVAYSWSTGTAVFFRLMDGRIAVQRKNGVWKIYRPKKHIVLSTNPRLSQLRKFDRAYSRLNKMVSKFKGKPKRVTIGPPTKYLSPVEKKQLMAGA